MPDRPGFAARSGVIALPRRVSSVFANATDGSRSRFLGRLAQPETSTPSAIAVRKRWRQAEAGATRASGRSSFIDTLLERGWAHEDAVNDTMNQHPVQNRLPNMEAHGDGLPPSVDAAQRVRAAAEAIYRAESRRVFATLLRLLGDFDLAEEALHDAFASAAEQWPASGVPAKPRAWLVSAGRFTAIDAIRRRARFDNSLHEIANRLGEQASDRSSSGDEEIEDDRLRLIFTCCH